MKCDKCNKQAVVHEVTIKNGVTNELHLCGEHAIEAGFSPPVEKPVVQLLASMMTTAAAEGGHPREKPTKCPACGLTMGVFKKTGALGCPACYDAFMPTLGQIIERAQAGASAHVGRRPGGSDDIRRVQALRAKLTRDLEAAVIAEQYERAAALRDEMAALDKKDMESP